MDKRDFPFQRLGSLEIEKSGVDYKASGLSQPLNGRWKTDHILRCLFNQLFIVFICKSSFFSFIQ